MRDHPDWKLVEKIPNVYDRAHTGNDMVRVTGRDSLFNSIVLRLMTIYREIDHTVYTEYGNMAWIYIGDNLTPQNVIGVRDYTEKALERITRIKRILQIDAKEDEFTPHMVHCIFRVLMDTGEETSEEVGYNG